MTSSGNDCKWCRENDVRVGDTLEGDEGYGVDRITIRYIGETALIAYWHPNGRGSTGHEGQTTLSCRDWKMVSRGANK